MMHKQRVLSGVRPTGRLQLGNYHGAVKNWVKLQHEYESFICIVDYHALTTHYADHQDIQKNILEMSIDLLAAGIDPEQAHLFVQSQVPEHCELHVLLSMITPLSWLERVPTYKDQQLNLKDKDLSTYGFLGYPLLQAADILIYHAAYVPVGEDQASHVEVTRAIARRFNYFYGRDEDYEIKAEKIISRLNKKDAQQYHFLRTQYQQEGKNDALSEAQDLLKNQQQLSDKEKERLLGYVLGGGKIILSEPAPLFTEVAVFPGLDGRKMSKSRNNFIELREDPKSVENKIRTMPTDPARVRRTDPGEPEKCPVWKLHQIYSPDEVKNWICDGCRTAKIGCLDCKRPLIDEILAEQQPIRERAIEFEKNPKRVYEILKSGAKAAREIAGSTIKEVRQAMGLEELIRE